MSSETISMRIIQLYKMEKNGLNFKKSSLLDQDNFNQKIFSQNFILIILFTKHNAKDFSKYNFRKWSKK